MSPSKTREFFFADGDLKLQVSVRVIEYATLHDMYLLLRVQCG